MFNDKIVDFVCEAATKLHDGQFRKDGLTPYISHPIAICKMMIDDGLYNQALFCVALLHDVVEDTEVTDKQLLEILFSAYSCDYHIWSDGGRYAVNQIYEAILDMTNVDKLYKSLREVKINRVAKKKLMNEHFARFASQYAIYTKIYDRYHNLLDLDTMKADNDFKKKYIEESFALVTALENGLNRYSDNSTIVLARLAKLKELLKEKDLCFSK